MWNDPEGSCLTDLGIRWAAGCQVKENWTDLASYRLGGRSNSDEAAAGRLDLRDAVKRQVAVHREKKSLLFSTLKAIKIICLIVRGYRSDFVDKKYVSVV